MKFFYTYTCLCAAKLTSCHLSFHVKPVLCHHGTARPLVEDGENDIHIWRVAVNTRILNNLSRTANTR
jgi:hypothetical protein